MSFTLIAHRGYSDLAPENTIEAFDLALERGYAHLELDVQLTKDGVPVVIHDPYLDRTTDASGPLRQRTLDELRDTSAGAWFDTAFAAARIPTLEAVLTRYAGRAHLHLELKSEEFDLPERVAPLLQAHGWTADAPAESVPGLTITSFHAEQLYRSLRLLPQVPHGWLLQRITEADLALSQLLGLAVICPRAPSLDVDLVRRAGEAGLAVRAWGVNDEADLLNAFHAGAAGATVNWPERAAVAIAAAETA